MIEIPGARASRRIFARLIWISWAASVVATALGFAAPWIPALELINDARPLVAAVAATLLLAAATLREWPLIRPTAALAVLQVGLLLLPWARAADSVPGRPPALRLVTFDLGADNDRFDDIADFILGTGADIVLLQEVSCSAAERLIPKLRAAYANAFVSADGCAGQALLAKRPWASVGQVITGTRKPLLVSARFQWNSTIFTLTGARIADPLAPAEQATDIERLRAHLATQGAAQIVAGALNLTPFAWKLAQLESAGFGQHATYLATWPAAWPLLLMDNVLSTDGIASVRVATGPPLGSDHRPLIADIAFVK
jgi:endonuclease/exonuclease/phosphatase (EEP) superfamily protein YafD